MPYVGRDLQRGNYLKLDDLESQFNGSKTTFNLESGGSAFYPGSAYSILVSLGGIVQEPESAYTINQNTITFAAAPVANDEFFCIALGVALGVGVPGHGTVNGSQLASPFEYDNYFYLDSANNRVGIHSSTPTVALDVKGDIKLSGSIIGAGGGIGGGIGTFTGLDVNGNADISGNLNVGGVLTYEDVTNVDAIGIVTARTGVRVLAGGVGIADTIFHIGDTDTSMRFNTDEIVFATGAASKVFINDDGDLTVGASEGNLGKIFIKQAGNTDTEGLALLNSGGGNSFRLFLGDSSGAVAHLGHGGQKQLNITQAGKVGIGTANPAGILEIDAASTTEMIMLDVAGTNFAKIGHNTASGTAILDIRSEGHTRFLTNGNNEKVRILNDGKVGINTSVPLAGLHISDGTVYGAPQNPNRKAALTISAGSEGSADIQLLSANYNHIFFGDSADPNTGIIWYEHTGGGTDSLNFSSGGNKRFNITSDGTLNKYISGTTVQAAFPGSGQVNGIASIPAAAGTPFIVGRDSGTTRSAHFAGHLQFDSGYGIQGTEFSVYGNTTGLHLNSLVSGDHIIFQTHNGSSLGERLRITSAGLLSIGNNSNLDSQLTVTQAQGDCIRLRSNATNNTYKYGIIKQEPYNNNALGVQIVGAKSDSGYTEVDLGGGIDGGYAATQLDFWTAANTTTATGTRRLRIASDGHIFFANEAGTIDTTARLGEGHRLQLSGLSSNDGISIVRYNTSYGAWGFNLGRSRSGTLGTNTILADGDDIGHITFWGADGSDFNQAAQISAKVDGSPSDGTDMPGALIFKTSADGSGSPTERLRINRFGNVLVGINPTTSSSGSHENNVPFCINGPTSNTITLMLGDASNGVGSLGANDYSADIRFNGANIAWGDISYYPNGDGGNGSFRFTRNGSTVATTGNATIGCAGVYVGGGNDGGNKFQLYGTTNDHVSLRLKRTNAIGNGALYGGLEFVDNSNNDIAYIKAHNENSTTASYLTFGTYGSSTLEEQVRIDSVGRLLVNRSNNDAPGGSNSRLQVRDTSYTASIAVIRNDPGGGGPAILFGKSRNATQSDNTLVQSGDTLGQIDFYGADGTDINTIGCTIVGQVDGTPGSNNIPGRLIFKTSTGGTSHPRITIKNDGKVAVGKDITAHRNLHVQEHMLIANKGTNSGQPYVSSIPILAVGTDGTNVWPTDSTYHNNALVSFGVGGHNAGNPANNGYSGACPAKEYFRLNLNGMMSIGQVNNSPNSTLHIRSPYNGNTTVRFEAKDTYNGSYPDIDLSFVQPGPTEIARIRCDTNTGAANQGALTFWTNHGGLAERMSISSQGVVSVNQEFNFNNNKQVLQRGYFITNTSNQTSSNCPAHAGTMHYTYGFQEAFSTTNGGWSYPYPDLVFGYHTGMRFGGYHNYGGMRFYSDHPNASTTLIFSINNGNSGVHVTNTFTAGTKTFRIVHPHPSKKYTHDLVHSVIEGPQCDNMYRGKVDLVGGSATINLDTVSNMTDGTFVLLNRDIQCFTTNETGWTAVKGSVSGNVLTITAQDNSCTDTISWMVIGERQDDKIKSPDVEVTDSNGKLITEPLTVEQTHM